MTRPKVDPCAVQRLLACDPRFAKRPIRVGACLGYGASGMVFKAVIEGIEEEILALKVCTDHLYSREAPDLMAQAIARELLVLERTAHPNLLSGMGLLDSRGHAEVNAVIMALEYMDGGMLTTRIHCAPPMQPKQLVTLVYQLLSGLDYMHNDCGLAHRDLKPQNILLDAAGNKLKIADFGSATEPGASPGSYTPGGVCTHSYCAPEHLLRCPHQDPFLMDVWGVGCVVYEMCFRRVFVPAECEVDALMGIFAALGTPDEHTWPGVSAAPEYQECFPRFRARRIEDAYNPKEDVFFAMHFVLAGALRLYPGDRIPVRDLRVPFHEVRAFDTPDAKRRFFDDYAARFAPDLERPRTRRRIHFDSPPKK